MLISVDQLNQSASRAPIIKDGLNVGGSARDFVATESTAPPGVPKGAILPAEINLAKRKEMLADVGVEPVDFAFERVIGNNDSVYSNFVDLIENAKRKVGRVVVKNGPRNIAFATGFMVSDQLLLTNWHVFNQKADVANSEVQFFYEFDIDGNPGKAVSFRLDAEKFFYSFKDLDYCFVAVSPKDLTGEHGLDEIGQIFLDPGIGKLGNENEEKLNIIHHPDGDYKQLSIRENTFVKITDTTIWYHTDTAPGSSGSPVFNDQWQIVALHHMGVASKNDQGKYIDKDGNIIPEVNGHIDGSKVVWIANEGIRVSVLLADVLGKHPDNPIVQGLRSAPAAVGPDQSSLNNSVMQVTSPDNQVTISFPASLMEGSGSIQININTQQSGKPVSLQPSTMRPLAVTSPAVASAAAVDEALDAEEVKKLEDSTDFSQCKGYQANFLGSGQKSIPMPQPQASAMKFAAKIQGGGIILKYFNYSTIFHSVRMVPMISAINVQGDPSDRQDKAKRKDNWLRDRRLSFDIQLNDGYYSKSGFDKGHMSRREDADWGDTADDAKRNADLTCMYTNACPQVAKINQSQRGGLWGELEMVVLEKGLEKEPGKTSKASVFNGPVFQDNDPVFKAIQVPMDFFKLIVWVTDDGQLKATAFRLSQTELVSDIDFEEIDIDQNTEFKEFQVSIQSLQDDTHLDFSAILALDTFEGNANEKKEVTMESVKAHVAKHNKRH